MSLISKLQKNKGFTLIELMVTITVMLIITSISLFNYSEFNSVTLTNNLAYDIALAVRQAQSYGVAVRSDGNGTLDGDSFSRAYGINFKEDSDGINFSLFVDLDGNDNTIDDRDDIQEYNVTQGSKIVDVCVDGDCVNGGSDVTILFKRPDPEPKIYYDDRLIQNENVIITIENSSGKLQKNIVVYPTGQISVKSVPSDE